MLLRPMFLAAMLAVALPAIAQTTESPSLGAVAINVADLEKSAAFYQAAFGFKRTGAHETASMKELILGPETGEQGASLVLVQPKIAAAPTAPTTRLVFFVKDAAAAAGKAGEGGATGVQKPFAVGAMKIAFARDLDGYLLEMIERPAK
ncbi:MAG: VOC family protein [Alphaproteobacteria bacterium]|nr:VOC family protein [Alphaproteobacteria bacterium]